LCGRLERADDRPNGVAAAQILLLLFMSLDGAPDLLVKLACGYCPLAIDVGNVSLPDPHELASTDVVAGVDRQQLIDGGQ